MIEGIKAFPWGGGGQLDIAANGDLVYQPGDRITTGRRLVWVDQEGSVEPAIERRDAFMESVRVSPDGRYAAVSTLRNKNELWRIDLETGARDRLWDEGEPEEALFNHDGSRIAFSTPPVGVAVGSQSGIVIKDIASNTAPVVFSKERCLLDPTSWIPDENKLIIDVFDFESQDNDIHLLDLETMESTELISTDQMEYSGALSPDGDWLLYGSSRSGERNVYLRAFPDGDTDTLISPGGAWGESYWSADGKTAYYAHFDTMYAVDIQTESELGISKPRALFKWPWADGLTIDDHVAIAPDGRFLMIEPAEWEKEPPRLIVVHNWLAELDERFGN